ncbi:MAG: hypothetical protein WA962_07210 [Ornithinimicrobium sp.]
MTTPDQPTAPQVAASKLAAALVGIEALVISGFAVFYAFELMIGEGSDPVVVIMSIVTMLVFVIGLAYVSAGLWVRHPRSQAPAMAFNGLMIPLGLAMFQFAPTVVAASVLLAGIVVIIAAFRMGQLD